MKNNTKDVINLIISGISELPIKENEDIKVQSDTIARTIVFALTLINQILAVCGKGVIDFAESNVYQIVSIILTVCVSVHGFWKNNSFTKKAIIADYVKDFFGGKLNEN